MAQYWIRPDSAELGNQPADFAALYSHSGSFTVVEIGGEYCFHLNSSGSHTARTIVRYLPAGEVADAEVYVLGFRSPPGVGAPHAMAALRAAAGVMTCYQAGWNGDLMTTYLGRLVNNTPARLSTDDGPAGRDDYYAGFGSIYGNVVTGRQLRFGNASSFADLGDPTNDHSDTALDSQITGVGWVGVTTRSASEAYIYAIGIGTDGDPAPTGPVEVSAEPFLLRHNPRTNKVIPVLSSPTVTDIGANCVRPRVTKGY